MTKVSLTILLLCAVGVGAASADSNLIGKTGFNVDSPKFTMDVKNADSGINSVIHITSGGGEHDGGFITSAGTGNGATGDSSNMFLSTGHHLTAKVGSRSRMTGNRVLRFRTRRLQGLCATE